MLRLIAALVMATCVSSSAFACTIITSAEDEPPPGLSDTELRAFVERRIQRDELARQRALWRDADYVFLAEVRLLRVIDENRIATSLSPVVSLKGVVSRQQIGDVYAPNFGNNCGSTPYPAIGESAIFYARKLPWWRRLLNRGRPEIVSAVPLWMVTDRQIPTQLRAAAARLRKTELQ
ncbi:MAG: hypothetical protein WC585_07225 [Brevundimonas sp.]